MTAQLTSASESEFLLLQPLTPLARPNLSGWLAARSDGDHYGELVLLRFPSDLPIYGPEQIQALINQDPEISREFGLWDRAGSEVVQGNLLVLPVGDALLYVEPVYLKAEQGGLPALKRVVVSDGSRVAMESTLLDAIQALLDGKAPDAEASKNRPEGRLFWMSLDPQPQLTAAKNSLLPTGSGFMVFSPGVQFAGQTSSG